MLKAGLGPVPGLIVINITISLKAAPDFPAVFFLYIFAVIHDPASLLPRDKIFLDNQ